MAVDYIYISYFDRLKNKLIDIQNILSNTHFSNFNNRHDMSICNFSILFV